MIVPTVPTEITYPTEQDPYYTVNGQRLIRVTAALTCIPRPHLSAWFGTMAARRAVDLLEKREDGRIDEQTFQELWSVDRIAPAGFEYRDFKGDIGTVLHSVAHDWALGVRIAASEWPDYLEGIIARAVIQDPEFQALPADALPYCESVLEFCQVVQPKFGAVGLETIGVNLTDEYAGRGDVFGMEIDRRDFADAEHPTCRELSDLIRHLGNDHTATVHGDWKGSNNKSKEWAYQLAAYARFEHLILSNGSVHEVPSAEANVSLWVRPKGSDTSCRVEVILQPNTEREYETFLCARDLFELHFNPTARVRLSRAKPRTSRLEKRTCPF